MIPRCTEHPARLNLLCKVTQSTDFEEGCDNGECDDHINKAGSTVYSQIIDLLLQFTDASHFVSVNFRFRYKFVTTQSVRTDCLKGRYKVLVSKYRYLPQQWNCFL
ncbi:hypothetical protein AMECASPLE_032544 [Ameca splendens]|uniref:Uncharacterized protein n=1 Tax=Ameca splendens TaxID=208324 RepID=A0ABV1A4K1_9TELE